MDQKEFGEYLRSLRKGKKLTLVELAEASNVSNPYISQIENGKFQPSNDILHKLAIPLGVSHFDLLIAAGYYTNEELRQRQEKEEYFNSMTPEEFDDYTKEEHLSFLEEEFKRLNHPELDELLKSSPLYFEKYELNREDKALVYKFLKSIFEDKEKNYPSEEKIRKDFLYHKNFKVNFSQLSNEGEPEKE